MAIRAGPLADSSLLARKLGEVDMGLYASAAYVRRRGMPDSIEALAQHRCVLFRPRDGANEWVLTGPDGAAVRVEARGQIGADDYSVVRATVAAGGGISLLPEVVGAATPEPLMRVLPGYVRRGATLFVVYPSTRNVPAKVSAFLDFLVAAFARRLT
jgi:DNA-binding transcriptional LysR family regulator